MRTYLASWLRRVAELIAPERREADTLDLIPSVELAEELCRRNDEVFFLWGGGFLELIEITVGGISGEQ